MLAARSSTSHRGAGGPDPGAGRPRRLRYVLAGLFAVCAFALPASAAFGDSSADLNAGPDGATRQMLYQGGGAATSTFGSFHTVLYVYAQAGETVQLGSSAMGVVGAGNILVYAPGTSLELQDLPDDPVFATDIFDCDTNDPGTGDIASRAQELAGPEASPDGDPATWVPCEFTPTTSGVYPVIMMSPDPDGASTLGGTVAAPVQPTGALTIAMWDITVRDASPAETVQPGRVFSSSYFLRAADTGSSAAAVFVYTKTGYEYQVTLFDASGVNWTLFSDDQGVVDTATGERLNASFDLRLNLADPANFQTDFRGQLGAIERRYPLFLNRPDPLVISGPGGLGERQGFATAPITPASNPVASSFTGSGGQSGATNHGSGGTIGVTSPTQMAGNGSTLEIDINRNGTFGDAPDYVDTQDLEADGSSAYAWNGRDATGNQPACGDYQYRVRATLAEVHFTMADVEVSGGTQIERLTLPNDPALGHPLAANYNDIDPFKNRDVLLTTTPNVAVNQTSGPGFHAWGPTYDGDTDYIDTWAKLPEVQSTGTLRLLCADVQVVKSATPSPATAGEELTFRLEVTNNGPDAATDVVVTDQLPSSVTFKSASPGCTQAAGTVTCPVGSLAAGANRTFEIVADVPSSATACIENIATVTNTTTDTNAANNRSQICVPVVGRSGVAMTKAASTATVATGGQVMYTLVVRNNGPSDDPRVRVTDPLPAGLTLVSAEASQGSCTTAANTVSCDLGALKDQGSAQVVVTVNVTATSGCITNVARTQGSRQDPDADDNQASAQVCVPTVPPVLPPTFDLAVDKRANVSRPVVGQRVTYRVVVRNNGPGAAPEAKLTDTFNNRATVVSVRTTQGTCTRELPITCELGRIESGASVTVTMVIVPLESGRQRNAASATSCCGTDGTPGNNMDEADINAQKIALRISKTVSSSTVRAGETFSYRIVVRNPSKGTARDVRVCDRLPSGLSFVRSAPSSRRSGSQRCWTIGSLAAGKSRSFRMTVRAASGASGNKVNRATLSSPDIKPATARRPVRVVGGLPGVTG
jgi:uncharacterized repeat protein (TIGR01451 family)